MSSTTTDFNEEQQHREGQPSTVGVGYIPTKEELQTIRECNQESFYYRSMPFSVAGMAVTQILLSRGIITASSRLGGALKVAFIGACGFMAGKVSYMQECQEKFKKLNSPLGEFARQKSGRPSLYSEGPQSKVNDPDTQSFDTMFQPAENPSHMSTHSRDYGSGYNPEPPGQMGRADDYSAPVKSYVEEEEEPKKKSMMYEDLRSKNRENYEVMLTQKADTLLKIPTDREPERFKKQVKKNAYGDAWEE